MKAARAGEAGKGFAVVADEVRKLADDSTKATHLITTMVSNIMDGLQSIVKATDLGHELSTQQNQAKVETEHAFETIATDVTSIQEKLEELVRSIERSNKMSNQVTGSVENISAITEETSCRNGGNFRFNRGSASSLRTSQPNGRKAQRNDRNHARGIKQV